MKHRSNIYNDDEYVTKTFYNYMRNGKVNSALKLPSKAGKGGVLPMNADTINLLAEKHPKARPKNENLLLEGPVNYVHEIVFD